METTEALLAELEPGSHPDLSTDVWLRADRDARYLVRIYATALGRRSRPVLTHLSAARVWGLPILGPWPRTVHLHGGRRDLAEAPGITWHREYLSDADITEVGGLLATTRLRTMVDLARTQPFRSAVISLDAGLQPRFVLPPGTLAPAVSRDRLLERVLGLGAERGAARARMAARFADPRSGSRGQSLSRASMYLARVPLPELGAACPHADGEDQVDFRWDARFHVKRRTLLGEFDCEVSRPGDRLREARLQASGRILARWRWADALHPGRLRDLLEGAGLRSER